MKLDSHQQDGTCPKQTVKPAANVSTSSTDKLVKKPSPLKKLSEESIINKNKNTTPKANRKSIKIKPRIKSKETAKKQQPSNAKKPKEDVISINEFAQSKGKISISKR